MMRFVDPIFLSLLILIVPIVLFGNNFGGRFRFSSLQNLKNINKQRKFHPRQILTVLRILSFVLLVLGLARPQAGKKYSEISSHGVDIFLALDTSGSMRALDFKEDGKPVDRLFIVKNVVKDFIKKRPSDRLGLVVFGSEAFTQCPLTMDHGILIDFLKKIEIGMAGDATAIGSAVGISVTRMKDLKSKSKIIILLTDGENTAGRINPVKAAEIAKTYGIKVYTIGVGKKGKAPFLQKTIFGNRYVYYPVNIDEDTLTKMSDITDAKYYRATDKNELQEIYNEIDKLEKSEVTVKEYTEYRELFHLYVLAALFFLLLEILLGNTFLRKIP